MNSKQIFVHIGTYKTGTSSIQFALAHSRHKLHKFGIHYMETGLNMRFCKHLPLFDHCHESRYNIKRHRYWSNVDLEGMAKKEILTSKARNYIISEEELSVPDRDIPKKLSFLSELGDVKVVLCVRRQDKFLESLYLQFMKEPGRRLKKSFADFLDDPEFIQRAKFDQIADFWADVFGVENVVVLDFDLVKQDNMLVRNFANLFGVPSDFEFEEVRRNQTISHEMAEIIRRMSVMYPKSRRVHLLNALRQLNIPPAKEEYVPLQMSSILPRYVESNTRLKERYGVDLLHYTDGVEQTASEKRVLVERNFERRMNLILMRLMKMAHKNQNWDIL